MIAFYENHEAQYAAHYQCILLMELLNEQGIDSHRYLKGTGLFYEDVIHQHKLISAQQMIKLIENAQHLGDGSTAFRWGHMLWPGHYDVYSQLIHHCESMADFLNVLMDFSQSLCPLVKPVVIKGYSISLIYWQDEMGVHSISDFLMAAYSTALGALGYWMFGEKYHWQVCLASNPKHIEEYQVNLGHDIRCNSGINILAVSSDLLNMPWSSSAVKSVHTILLRQAKQQYGFKPFGLVGAMTEFLQQNIHSQIQLEQAACAFNMSSATLKRKLKQHGTSFQKLQDAARLNTCLYLQHEKQWTNQQIAEHLKFSDANNFRKAFKRWSGKTPSHMREMLVSMLQG